MNKTIRPSNTPFIWRTEIDLVTINRSSGSENFSNKVNRRIQMIEDVGYEELEIVDIKFQVQSDSETDYSYDNAMIIYRFKEYEE